MADTEKLAPTGPGGNNPPILTRAQRKGCHAQRDKYFECLDSKGIDDPEKAGSACAELRKTMYAECPEAWATYFEKLRAMRKEQEKYFNPDGSLSKMPPPQSALRGERR
ncbi:hypothetical protein EV175_005093 [Coemansia sp. RSA 1933]|nr:hypothetical protein EV175_005093 [Coemansia sp. RSA 1933]